MRNMMGGRHELEEGRWILSLVRRQAGEHVCLILEGLDAAGAHYALRADLGYKQIPTGFDKTAYNINVTDISDLEQYRQQTSPAAPAERRLAYVSAKINAEQKTRFDTLIERAQWENDQPDIHRPYAKVGNQNSIFGGFLGTSLEGVGSTSVKDASVSSTHTASLESEKPSVQASHTSLVASLIKGHSCASWAIEVFQDIVPGHERTTLSAFIATDPVREIPDVAVEPPAVDSKCFIL